jgi:hypothetical protein
MTFLRFISLSLVFLLAMSICISAQEAVEGSSLVVIVEIRSGHPSYLVNGKVASDPLRALENLWNEKSKNLVVDIMVDPHATFLQLGETEGLVSKAGFQHWRAFVYSRESGMREQIIRNPSERYSAKP